MGNVCRCGFMVMSDPLSVNLKHFKQKVNIKDSLELIDYRTKRKSLKVICLFQCMFNF